MSEQKDTVLYDGKEWFLYITRNVPFWGDCLMARGNYSNFKDFGILACFPILATTFDGMESHFFSFEPAYLDSSNVILSSCLGKERMAVVQKKYEVLGEKFLNSLEKCLNEITVSNLQNFIDEYTRYSAGLNLTAILGRVGASALMAKLATLGVAEEKIPEIISIITYPKQHTPLFLSQHDLYVIAAKLQVGELTDKDIENELQVWLSKYRHIPVNFTGEPWTIEDARLQLAEIRGNDATRELKRMTKDHSSRALLATKMLSKFKDKELVDLATTIAEATYLNEYRKDIFSRVSLGFRPIFQKIAELGGASHWRDCFYLTPEEMTSILKGQKISILEKVKERAIVAVRVKNETELDILDLKDTERFAAHVRAIRGDGESLKQDSFNGYSANRGKVIGKVKIIFGRADFHKLKTGDILVAMATSVDYVSIMQKAVAFVTNEGGITSHASIVAREMNKPCIIGTKIATKVLKDGDLVEVDADNGVVKILRRS